MSAIEELREDLRELQELRGVAKRKFTLLTLDQHVDQLEKSIKKLAEAEEKKNRATSEDGTKEVQNKSYTITLRTYSWDQSDKFMKLYVTIPGLKASDGEKVSCQFGKQSVVLDVKQLGEKNYNLVINNLAAAITPDSSHWKVKSDLVVVLLSKARTGVMWSAVTAEEARLKEKNKPEKAAAKATDPNDSIMGLMKQMYDDGDDKMKQMLNKTWYETQMKNGGAGGMGAMPGMGDMGDF